MKRQRSGKIDISSIAGRGRSPSSSAAYATAKGGIIALTKKLSYELGPYGITVNAIAPSLTLSPRLQPRWDRMTAEEREAENARVPLRRVAVPEDQARVICFLASRDADFVTGVTIDVTGGSYKARGPEPGSRRGDHRPWRHPQAYMVFFGTGALETGQIAA
jgi:NAD(P)-dependent dehydrogenase (short-subunit alcohol dehydrogenase family)